MLVEEISRVHMIKSRGDKQWSDGRMRAFEHKIARQYRDCQADLLQKEQRSSVGEDTDQRRQHKEDR